MEATRQTWKGGTLTRMGAARPNDDFENTSQLELKPAMLESPSPELWYAL